MPKPTSPLRRLEGITYWVIEDPDDIYAFINDNVRMEWEADARGAGRKIGEDTWLIDLPKLHWMLKVVETSQVRLDPDIMNYRDDAKGYVFVESLARRARELRTAIETYRTVIWPIIVAQEGLRLVDGYCRYTAVKDLSVSRIYSYIGSMPK